MERASLRVGDVERRQAADTLQRHFVDGRLTPEELTQRVSQALAARTQGDLDALLADLPPLPPPTEEAAAPRPSERDDPRGIWAHSDIRAHVSAYALVMVLLVAIWLITTPGRYFWPIWPMLGWGVGVAAHLLARLWGQPKPTPTDGSRPEPQGEERR